eukprot:gnl/TRDRNA2_/TRDRNA2_34241_c0_seq1.p1 gnl/TRDRNA2_/TRDRNA2_34241_c0~~gnl/TRDRNA2_/TRDRNA2_34241_c0_seq1.p1  ORF type:complete len:145 (+),score=26.48 gnl/TRDRNA2_/TRDRNA2_34241_c0_seq1:286-720(+)
MRATERLLDEFTSHNFAIAAWAFAMARKPAAGLLDPLRATDEIGLKSARMQVKCYQMTMEYLAATGNIVTGFALLSRLKAGGLLTAVDEANCYPMFRTLLEACHVVGDSGSASRVASAVRQLGLLPLAPGASMHLLRAVQGDRR